MDLPLRKTGVPLGDTVSAGDAKRHLLSTPGTTQKDRVSSYYCAAPVSRKMRGRYHRTGNIYQVRPQSARPHGAPAVKTDPHSAEHVIEAIVRGEAHPCSSCTFQSWTCSSTFLKQLILVETINYSMHYCKLFHFINHSFCERGCFTFTIK